MEPINEDKAMTLRVTLYFLLLSAAMALSGSHRPADPASGLPDDLALNPAADASADMSDFRPPLPRIIRRLSGHSRASRPRCATFQELRAAVAVLRAIGMGLRGSA